MRKAKCKLCYSVAVSEFTSTYKNAKEAKRLLHEIFVAAFGSAHADMWTKKDRANILLFEELIGGLIVVVFKSPYMEPLGK